MCSVCCKAILDATNTREGQQALECEGSCRKWIHRWCAGVHKQDYLTLSNSSDLWICPSCSLKEYGQLIKALVNTVGTLRAEVASLKKQINSNSCPPHEDPKASYATVASGAVTTIPSHQLYLHLLLLLYNLLLLMLLPRVSKKVYPLIILIGSSISLCLVSMSTPRALINRCQSSDLST